ncbi:MAG: allantoinase AllB [Gemmatimonadales bacterium]
MIAPSLPAALRSTRVVTPEGVRPASIHIDNGFIVRVRDWSETPVTGPLHDAGNLLVMPGLIDTHVHVNEPGRTEWEGFATATRAAAAGGITTIGDMPLNAIPPTTTLAALECKRAAAQPHSVVRVEYIGGVVPGNGEDLPRLVDRVCAFKCFLAPSGVPEFPSVTESDLREALPVLAGFWRPLMVHAEDPDLLQAGRSTRRYADYLASRPVAAEREAIARLIRLLGERTAPIHVVHLSSASSLELVLPARARGLPISVETCPHYLTFAAEEIPDGATEYKCAPPIRSAAEREALWSALLAGEIDCVVSDHSPCPPELKGQEGDFFAAWGGIASLELSLSAVWTGARARGVRPERLAEWMSTAPARLVGLADRGQIAERQRADLVVWDPERRFVVDPNRLVQRHKLTPYAGRELFGVVQATYVGGRPVFGGL